jgi:hypothetical protein
MILRFILVLATFTFAFSFLFSRVGRQVRLLSQLNHDDSSLPVELRVELARIEGQRQLLSLFFEQQAKAEEKRENLREKNINSQLRLFSDS